MELLRLHGDERWSEWGVDWAQHADRVAELPPTHVTELLAHFKLNHMHPTRLDWGALLYALRKPDLEAIYSADGELIPPHSARMAGQSWKKRIGELDADDAYGLVVVESA